MRIFAMFGNAVTATRSMINDSRAVPRDLRTSLAGAAFCGLWMLLAALPAGAQVILIPPEPTVRPLISTTYANDTDGDGIADALFDRAQAAEVSSWSFLTTEAGTLADVEDVVDVELIFDRQITQEQVATFQAFGGEIDYVYKAVSYGWNGRIPLGNVIAVSSLMSLPPLLIQEAKPAELHMVTATRTGRVRPVWAAGFAGNAAGFDGDVNTTIGIVDTGVDQSHTDLTGRCAYWKDHTSDGAASPIDIVQHGSHVTGIALGTGVAGGSGAGTMSYTQAGTLSGVTSGSFYPSPIELPAVSLTYTATARWNGGGSTTLYLLTKMTGTSAGWQSYTLVTGVSPLTISYALTGETTRVYSAGLLSNGAMTDFVVTSQVTNYPAVGDGFNKFSGVAPGCRWAGAKVFTNAGSGTTFTISAGIDDLVANRVAYNIKVMNLSLGIIGDPGLDTTERQKVNTAVNNGIVVVVSAGNDGLGTTAAKRTVDDPGRAAMALTVAASNDANRLTDYTSQGFTSPGSASGAEEDYKPDVMAPGGSQNYQSSILSVDSNSGDGAAFTDQQANDYLNIQGTSMASPFVAGCAALVIDALQQRGVTWDFASSQHARYVKMVLCATTSESNANREDGGVSRGDGITVNPTLQRASAGPNSFPPGKDQYEGYGMINPDAAVEAVSQTYTSGATATATLGASVTDRRVWARTVSLSGGQAFHPALTVPAGGDFDLYLYRAEPSAYGTPVLLASSTATSSGTAETFSYTPSSATTGLLVVKRVSGSGTFTLISDTPPTVTTQAVSAIGTMTATGNGNVTAPGVPNPSAHGVCWNTTGTPTIADSRTDEGATSAPGAFTSVMTGLSTMTLYHVRAYATNAAGTAYGGEVTFMTESAQSAAPTAVDLVAASDTGVSNTDNFTKLNNTDPATVLAFDVSGTVAGAEVNLYADGILVGRAVAGGTITTVTTDGATVLADGARTVTATQTEAGKIESAASPRLTVTVDTEAPYRSTSGVLNPSFGTAGLATMDVTAGDDWGRCALLQPDGKIVVAGQGHVTAGGAGVFAVCRFNADGSPDMSFGLSGKVQTAVGSVQDDLYGAALQPDGKIVVVGCSQNAAGNSDFALARYDRNGLLDASFGSGGIVRTNLAGRNDQLYAVAVRQDGCILAAGVTHNGTDFDVALALYDSSGTLVPSFGSAGVAVTGVSGTDYAYALALQGDGKAVLAGSTGANRDLLLLRYTVNGTLDSTFGTGGVAVVDAGGTTEYLTAVALQPDGRIVAAGSSDGDAGQQFMVARFGSTGALDTGFGSGGIARTDFGSTQEAAYGLALQSDGKILATGVAVIGGDQQTALARYTAAGQLDTTFGAGGNLVFSLGADGGHDFARAVMVDGDGSILTAGSAVADSAMAFALARVQGDGAPSAPDLLAASDSGVSDTDNVTNDTTPTLAIVAVPYWRLYLNGTQISADYASGPQETLPVLADGTYEFTLMAVDAAGNASAQSQALSVTIDATAPTLLTVLSRKAHAGKGTFDISLPVASPWGDEGRKNGPTDMRFRFSEVVLPGASFMVTPSAGTAAVTATALLWTELAVSLSGATDVQWVRLAISGMEDRAGNSAALDFRVGYLYGDTNSDRVVNIVDVVMVKAKYNLLITADTNFVYDLDTSGAINIVDVVLNKAAYNNRLPTPP